MDISKYLSDHGVKVSFQRMRIFTYFVKHRNHPTVNDIYEEVAKEIPTLSKTTVYNTLSLFVEKNILDVIIIEENETRYDWGECIHGHFKCDCCKEIYDIGIDINTMKKQTIDLKGFKINEHHIYFKGFCPKCIKK
nr:Fur family transcriptional regulator [Marinisporobacter balticus]